MDKQEQIIVSTHQGRIYDEHCDHIVVKNKEGEFAIYPNHIPVITSFEEGFVKLVRDKDVFFIGLTSAVVEFHQNKCIVLAQEAHIGRDMESAIKHMEIVRNERLEKNRKLDADLTVKEKEIIDNIKKAKAGSL